MTESIEEKTLRRVLFISGLDGWSVALFAGFCTLISLLMGEWIGVSIGAIITACGVFELRGRKQITRGDADGMKWLIRAQVFILCTIWLYASENMFAYDEAAILAGVTPEMTDALNQAGMSINDLRSMIKPVFYGFYLVVMAVTLLFQGGLALYYRSARDKVRTALSARARPSVPPVL